MSIDHSNIRVFFLLVDFRIFCPCSSSVFTGSTWSTGVPLQKWYMMPVSLSLNRWLTTMVTKVTQSASIGSFTVFLACICVYSLSTVNMGICWGFQSWEWVMSLDFEWRFISGKKKFRWPMVCFVFTYPSKPIVNFVTRRSFISSIATALWQR